MVNKINRFLRLFYSKTWQRISSKMPSCGPLGNSICSQANLILNSYSKKNIFLDIPFSGYSEQEKVLREVVEQAELIPVVSKDELTSNVVACKVCRKIQSCKYGIADISFERHSVTYELGLMHGFEKKVCVLLQDKTDKFSDILGLEHLPYSGKRALKIKIAKWLMDNVPEANRQMLKELLVEQEKALQDKGEAPFAKAIPKKPKSEDFEKQLEKAKKFSSERFNDIKS